MSYNWNFWKRKSKYWAHLEWANSASSTGSWEQRIESDKPLVVTINDFKDLATLWVDDCNRETVFFAHANTGSVAVEIDQEGSKLEVNP